MNSNSTHCALKGRREKKKKNIKRVGKKGAIFHAFCVVCASVAALMGRSVKGCKKDLVSGGWYAAADFLGFGTESYSVLKVIQVIGLKMLLMKTCTFVPSTGPGGCLRTAAAPIPLLLRFRQQPGTQ